MMSDIVEDVVQTLSKRKEGNLSVCDLKSTSTWHDAPKGISTCTSDLPHRYETPRPTFGDRQNTLLSVSHILM
jgi:hypothetical protein